MKSAAFYKTTENTDYMPPNPGTGLKTPQTIQANSGPKRSGTNWLNIWLNLLERAMAEHKIIKDKRKSIRTFVSRYLTANPWPPLNIRLYRLEDFIHAKDDKERTEASEALKFFYTNVRYSDKHLKKIWEVQGRTSFTWSEAKAVEDKKKLAPERKKWLEATILEIKVRNYSNSTKKEYVRIINEFLTFIKSDPKETTVKEVKEYIVHLKDTQKFSPSTVNNYKSALTFFFREVLERENFMLKIPRMRQPKTIPEHFSKSEITSLIQVTHNLKHRILIASIYGMGLRLSEAISLKVGHLRFEDLETHVHLGKGKKDRIVVLKDRLSRILQSYVRNLNSEDYLFPGRKPGAHLSRRSAQKILETACIKAKTPGKRNVHKLRHSFANHLLEDGVPTAIIKELLGHKQLKTTELYSHPTREALKQFNNPLNNIDF